MVVRPMLTYGTIMWGDRAKLKTKQGQVHRAMCICPTATMEVTLEFTPLHRVLEV